MTAHSTLSQDNIRRVKKRIGELLIEDGLVERFHVDEALSIQKRDGGKTVDIMINCGFIDVATFENFLTGGSDAAMLSLGNYHLSPDVYNLVPEEFATKHDIFLADRMGNILSVAMAYPLDWRTVDEITEMTGLKVSPFLCRSSEIRAAHTRYYGGTED